MALVFTGKAVGNGTESLLEFLVNGNMILPKLKQTKKPSSQAVEPEPEDPEKKILITRLGRAADMLDKKRKKKH